MKRRTNSNLKIGCVIRYYWDEVIRDDSELMSVERDAHGGIDSGINNSKTVSLSTLQSHAIVTSSTLSILVGTIDEDIVTSGWWTTETTIECAGSGLELVGEEQLANKP